MNHKTTLKLTASITFQQRLEQLVLDISNIMATGNSFDYAQTFFVSNEDHVKLVSILSQD